MSKKNRILSKSQVSKNINIMIACTHHNEENLIIPCLETISKVYPICKFFIAPRHPTRSKKIYDFLKSNKLDVQLDSTKDNNECKYLIIDSLGKMDEFYIKCDIVFIGGSLSKNGGHNPIEAGLANSAIITGPNIFNWQNLYEEMIEKKACIMINNHKELEKIFINLINDKNLIQTYQKKALSFSNNVFFEEEKLINKLNTKLKTNA